MLFDTNEYSQKRLLFFRRGRTEAAILREPTASMPHVRRTGVARWSLMIGAVATALLVGGCKKSEEKGEAPPPPPKRVASPCDQAKRGLVDDLVAQAHGYCVDPNSDVRRYGVGTSAPLDAVCTELFNGECELYKSYGLEGVKTLRYVEAAGGPHYVNVIVSRFRESEGAFGFFTRRILGDSPPDQATVKAVAVDGRAVQGLGTTYLWRGKQVLELSYVSDDETPDEIAQKTELVLVPLTETLAHSLVGPTSPTRAITILEQLGAVPLGVRGEIDGLVGVAGSGAFATGYFQGTQPYRLIVAERRDETGASDLLRLLRQTGRSYKLKNRDVYRVSKTEENASPEQWYVASSGALVLGVGPFWQNQALQGTAEEREEKLEDWESFALKQLEALKIAARASEQQNSKAP